jgi:hypothetical protein
VAGSTLMVAKAQRNKSFATTFGFRDRVLGQPDVTGMVNMANFPGSRHGQRNGSRAPNLSSRDLPRKRHVQGLQEANRRHTVE